jgi:mycothiol synthase
VIRLPPGYSSRAATRSDLDAIVEVFRAWERLHLDELVMSRATLEDDWSHGWFDPVRDTMLIEAGDTAVAYASCASRAPEIPFDSWGSVRPDHEGQGLGTALVRWTEERARRDLPHGSVTKLWNGANGRNDPALRLFDTLGYRSIRTFQHMAMAVPPTVPLDGESGDVEIHACREAWEERGLWEALQDAFSTHFGFFAQPLDAWWSEQRGYPTFDPELMLVAVSQDDVVGGVIAYVDDDVGWIGEVGVRGGWQRRGVGRALLLRTLALFAGRGLSTMRLNVDLENASSASDLYRSIGMRVVQEWRIFEKSITQG